MTGTIRNQRQERQLDSYVESPTRPNKTAQECVVTNPLTISTSGLATEAKQDVGNSSLGSIDTKLSSQATAANQAIGGKHGQSYRCDRKDQEKA